MKNLSVVCDVKRMSIKDLKNFRGYAYEEFCCERELKLRTKKLKNC